MNQISKANEQGEPLRLETISLLEQLAAKAAECELPPEPALANQRQRLIENAYRVLVVGEAKRGKSTFVNALLGRDLLPTDVDVATSQVFHITPSEHEAFRLRFEDGSAQEITRDDLPRYGSQVVADTQGEPELNQVIRWIEVETPIRFLPPGVSLLDTPGLGALYASHARITERFVEMADAFIFALDSGQPVTQSELDFIARILGVTRHVFFIQTKIDQHRREHWQALQRRNEEILAARFKDRLNDTRVWPISSANLRRAADAGQDEEVLLTVSRYREMEAALQAFLFRVAGWSRIAETLVIAHDYHATTRQTLAARQAVLTQESREQQEAYQQAVAERQAQYHADWGERGRKRFELLDETRRILAINKQSFANLLQPGGELAAAQEEKISAVKTIEEANQLGAALADETLGALLARWRHVRQQTQAQCTELLVPLLEDAAAIFPPPVDERKHLTAGDLAAAELREGLWKRLTDAYREAIPLIGVGGLAAGKAALFAGAAAGALGVLAGVAGAAAIGVMAYRIIYPPQSHIKAAQHELRKQLDKALQRARRYFLEPDAVFTRYGMVEGYFHEIERAMSEQIEMIVVEKTSQARAEHQRLTAQSQLDSQQRKVAAVKLRQQLANWDELGRTITGLSRRLNQVESQTH